MRASRIKLKVSSPKTPVARVRVQGTPVVKTKKKTSQKLSVKAHKDTQKVKLQIVNRISKTPAKRPVTAVAVLSPFRFPIPRTQTLTLVARVIGLCFVVTGASFFGLTLGKGDASFFGMGIQTAETITASSSGSTEQSHGENPNSTNQVPPLTVSISIPNDTVQGVTLITVNTVADSVNIYAQKMGGSKVKLGAAKRTDNPGVWNYSWDTQQFTDGTYTISALAQGQAGALEVPRTPDVVVQNAPKHTEEKTVNSQTPHSSEGLTGDSGPNSVNEGSTTVPVETSNPPQPPQQTPPNGTINSTPSVALSIPQSTLQGNIQLLVNVSSEAESVRVSAYNTATGALFQAGLGEKINDGVWQLYWDTTNVVNGTYKLIATAVIKNTNYDSPSVVTTVANELRVNPTPVSTSTPQAPSEDTQEALNPQVTLTLSQKNPLIEYVTATIVVADAQNVELYRQPVQSLATYFLGQAKQTDATRWVFTWNTKETPNGDYYLFTRIKNKYGVTDNGKMRIQVKNTVLDAFNEQQSKEIDDLTKANDVLVRPVATNSDANASGTSKTLYIEPVDSFITSVDTDETSKEEIVKILKEFRTRLDKDITSLSQALRANNTDAIAQARAEIENLKKDIQAQVPDGPDKAMLLDRVTTYIDRTAQELDALAVRNNNLLKERIGDAATKDSDKDGISDYDEIHLYQTNPFTADTDGDGFIDGAEIAQGFNPNDSRSQSVIAYESPQDSGFVREDILKVASVSSLSFKQPSGEKVQGLFAGKGLPNSFVTLYIYSTPIIVTVKTDADGNWNYLLDKDLEDGNHEVYIGITDNSGRLVAKSNPLPFVKTAEAYTATNGLSSENESTGAPSLIEGNILVFVSAGIVLILGLLLLLIGIYARSREHEEQKFVAPAL